MYWTQDRKTKEIESWDEHNLKGISVGADDKEAQNIFKMLSIYAVGSIDDKSVPQPNAQKTPSNLISLKQIRWEQRSQQLKDETMTEDGYFVGAYNTRYIYWSNADDLRAAILKNNPDPLKGIKIGSLDLSKAYQVNDKAELQRAIDDGKVYAYTIDSHQLYLPENK